MAQTVTDAREQAHALIERMPSNQLSSAVTLLKTMVDPVSRAIASAPIDDEPETDEERNAVAASKLWFAEHPEQGIGHEDLMAEFGLLPEEKTR